LRSHTRFTGCVKIQNTACMINSAMSANKVNQNALDPCGTANNSPKVAGTAANSAKPTIVNPG
jgi:hypothetical protein